MAKIPLNYFRRISRGVTTTPTSIYTTPFQRAGIIISALATNTVNTAQTINAGLSTTQSPGGDVQPSPYISILQGFQLPPNDTVNIVVNKLVLSEYDNFIVNAPQGNGTINITLSILETVNTPF
jgi:hypothetical protein